MTTTILLILALCVGGMLGFLVFAMLQVSHTEDRMPRDMPRNKVLLEP